MQENIYPVLQYSHSTHCLIAGRPTILLYPKKKIHKKKKIPICIKIVDEVLDATSFSTKNQLT